VNPGALQGLLVGMGVPETTLNASVTFVEIVMTTLIQATTKRRAGRKLGLP
jgi:hypothetical protein